MGMPDEIKTGGVILPPPPPPPPPPPAPPHTHTHTHTHTGSFVPVLQRCPEMAEAGSVYKMIFWKASLNTTPLLHYTTV
jgi:hypothetical protein